jgi:Flp pilus assembly protein TadG
MLNPAKPRAWRGMAGFRRDRRSTAAMEFAFIAPIMVVFLLGSFEITNAVIIYEEVQNAAHAIPASASNLAVQNNGATQLTYQQIQLAASEIWATIPELRGGLEDGTKSITISSVTFLPTLPPASTLATAKGQATCTPSKTGPVTCNYTPTVVWSVTYAGGDSGRSFVTGASAQRSCTGAPTATGQNNAVVENSAGTGFGAVPGGLNNEATAEAGGASAWKPQDLTSLPTFAVAEPDPYLAAPSPILVVDVHLKYTSVLGLFLQSGLDFYGSGFFPVRSVQSSYVNSGGTTTAYTLSQQFTTIEEDANDESLAGAPAGSYCINSSVNLSPAAES